MAEGDAVTQVAPTDELMRLLQSQGVQATPENLSRMMSGMMSQAPEPQVVPLGAPIAPGTPRAAAPTVRASTGPNSRQQMEDYSNTGGGGSPAAPAASSEMPWMELLAALAAGGGAGYLAGRGRGAPGAPQSPVPPSGGGGGSGPRGPQSPVPPGSPASKLSSIVPSGGVPKSSMPVGPSSLVPPNMSSIVPPGGVPQSSVAPGPTSAVPQSAATVPASASAPPTAPASSTAPTPSTQPTNPLARAAANASPVTGQGMPTIDWPNSGIGDPLAMPPAPGTYPPTAVDLGPQQELQRVAKATGVDITTLDPKIQAALADPVEARALANRPNMLERVKQAIIEAGQSVAAAAKEVAPVARKAMRR